MLEIRHRAGDGLYCVGLFTRVHPRSNKYLMRAQVPCLFFVQLCMSTNRFYLRFEVERKFNMMMMMMRGGNTVYCRTIRIKKIVRVQCTTGFHGFCAPC